MLAALIAQFRDFDVAEEALQDAMIEAARSWPRDGTPSSGSAWLLTVARRRALDRLRKSARAKSAAVFDGDLSTGDETPETAYDIPDERLRLIFTCCHPALSQEARVALTLRSLCGLAARDIARAFLVPDATMNQRLTRAKAKIRHTGIPYRVPEMADLPARLNAVLSVIYLIYNAGYAPLNPALSQEALRLCAVLHRLQPLPETAGLWALMQLHSARDASRLDRHGALVSLKDQDRSLWDRAAISDGKTRLLRALGQKRPGPYQIQAAISALHCEAQSWENTDWPQILGLYEALYRHNPTPVVALNRAVALAHTGAADAALKALATLEDPLKNYQPYYAARAELRAQLGQTEAAKADFAHAIALTTAPEEQAFLRRKQQELP